MRREPAEQGQNETAGHVSDRDITVLSCVCEECITGNWLLSQLFISYHTANSLFAFYNKNGKSVSIANELYKTKGWTITVC